MNDYKITAEELKRVSISRLSTHPNSSSVYGTGKMSDRDLKAQFDNQAKLLADKFNEFLDIIGKTGEGSFADKIRTNIEEAHTLRMLFEDIVSETGEFAQYLTVGDGTLANKLAAIANEFEEVQAKIERGDEAFSEHKEAMENGLAEAVQNISDLDGRMDTAETELEAFGGRASIAEDNINALKDRMDDAEDDIDALKDRMDDAEDELSTLGNDALRKNKPNDTQVVEGVVNFEKEVRFGGNVIFEGNTTTAEKKVMMVEDALIVVNSGKAATASIKGYVIRTEKGDYAIYHDPEDDAIKLAIGEYKIEEDGKGNKKVSFEPTFGQAQSLLTRDSLSEGNWLRWDAENSTVVNAGKPTPGRLLMADDAGNVIDGTGVMEADGRLIVWSATKGYFVDSSKTIADIISDYEAYVDDWVAARGENGVVKVADAVDREDAVNLGMMVQKTSNPLYGEVFGDAIRLHDVSSNTHQIEVSVESRNLVPAEYYSVKNVTAVEDTTTGKNIKKVTISGITYAVYDDGSVKINGQNDGSGNSSFFLVSSKNSPLILKKGTYIGSTGVEDLILAAMKPDGTYITTFENGYIAEEDTPLQYLYFGVNKGSARNFDNEMVYPMLVRGTSIPTSYIPPVSPGTDVVVTGNGKNLFQNIMKGEVDSDVGITVTSNGDGSFTAKGKATRDAYVVVNKIGFDVLQGGKFYFKANGGNKNCYIYARFRKGESSILTIYPLVDETFSDGITIDCDSKDYDFLEFVVKTKSNVEVDITFKPQLEQGSEPTKYEMPSESVIGKIGEKAVLSSFAPIMNIRSDNKVTLVVKYNRDINIAFAELQQAIISLGGNV